MSSESFVTALWDLVGKGGRRKIGQGHSVVLHYIHICTYSTETPVNLLCVCARVCTRTYQQIPAAVPVLTLWQFCPHQLWPAVPQGGQQCPSAVPVSCRCQGAAPSARGTPWLAPPSPPGMHGAASDSHSTEQGRNRESGRRRRTDVINIGLQVTVRRRRGRHTCTYSV